VAEGKSTEQSRRQGQRLRALRERLGISKGLLMHRLDFRTSRGFDLYEEGTSAIRLDFLEKWAAAYDLSVQAFVAEIVLGESEGDAPGVTMVRLSHEWAEIQRQTEGWPPEAREMALRAFRESIAAMNAIGSLARKN
jgi:transcriptional regulator with XRE-family HTH domain